MRISRIRLSSGIMHLALGAPAGNYSRYRRHCVPPAPRSCTASPALCLSPTRRQACSRPDGTEPPFGPAPSLSHVMLRNSPPLHAGFVGKATPAGFRPSVIPPTSEAPFLDGHYPAFSVLRASPPPCRPGLPLAGSRLPRARHRQGFPCCYAFHLPCMSAPLPRRKPAGAHVALFPASRLRSPFLRRVGFRETRFEACSAFTRVPSPFWPARAAVIRRSPALSPVHQIGVTPRLPRMPPARWRQAFPPLWPVSLAISVRWNETRRNDKKRRSYSPGWLESISCRDSSLRCCPGRYGTSGHGQGRLPGSSVKRRHGRGSPTIQGRFSRFFGTVQQDPGQRQEAQIVQSQLTLDDFLP